MRVSVALATYNGVLHIVEQLDSVRCQTRVPDEVIIFDDGSTDGTVDMVQEYVSRYQLDGWSIRRNKRNLGFAENFHTLARACSGDIVFFCDQDDIWYRQKVERLCCVLEENPDIMVLCCEYDILGPKGCESRLPAASVKAMTGDGSLEKIEPHFGGVYIWLGCAMAARKDFLNLAEDYWVEGWAHDECVWKLSQAIDGCFVLHEPLLQHRMHASNVTGRKTHDREQRAHRIREKMLGDEAAVRFAISRGAPKRYVDIFRKSAECERLRVELLSERKPSRIFRLLPRIFAYQEKKSYLADVRISLGDR